MTKRRNTIEGIKEVLNKIIGNIETQGPCKKDKTFAAWENTVGKEASRHSRPVGIRKNILTVEIDSSAWFYEINLRKQSILKDIKELLKEEKIQGIKFRMGDIKE